MSKKEITPRDRLIAALEVLGMDRGEALGKQQELALFGYSDDHRHTYASQAIPTAIELIADAILSPKEEAEGA